MVCLVAMCATAAADPKPTLAIVDVIPKDAEIGKTADAVTAALRANKPGPYQLKGSRKEVAAAAIKADCDARKPTCAAAIGAALDVDYVLVGELESRGDHPVLALSLFDVRRYERVRSVRDSVARNVDTRRWAAKVYERLVGGATGELVIVANAQRGDIVIDGQIAAALFDGRATITGLALGPHELGIRAAGFRPIDIDITVDATTQQTLLLDPI